MLNPLEHLANYTAEFQSALKMVQAWYKNQPASEMMENQIENWIRTCDLLIENNYFNEQCNWKIPTLQPWYHFDTHLCLQQYFYIRNRIEPSNHPILEKQKQAATKMFETWEEACFRVFQRNHTPIPKYLWYYKYKYIQHGNSDEWRNFFHDTPFQTWDTLKKPEEKKRDKPQEITPLPQPPLMSPEIIVNLTPTG